MRATRGIKSAREGHAPDSWYDITFSYVSLARGKNSLFAVSSRSLIFSSCSDKVHVRHRPLIVYVLTSIINRACEHIVFRSLSMRRHFIDGMECVTCTIERLSLD